MAAISVDITCTNDKDTALSLWKENKSSSTSGSSSTPADKPILPKSDQRNILITSTLLPVVQVPHLGDILSSVLSADVFNRYCQQRGINTLFIGGVNDHGTTTEDKAREEGLSIQEIHDKYYQLHVKINKWLNVKFSVFGRTENKENTRLTQEIFWKLYEKKCITKGTVKQLYCEQCSKLLIEGQVIGNCPICLFEDIIKSEKCQRCGHLLNSSTLLKCGTCCSKSPSYRETSQLVTTNDNLLISRCGLGVSVPLNEYTDRVFCEQFVSCIPGYMSITASYTNEWMKWWGCGSEVELYQFMSVDHTPFHSLLNELNNEYIIPTGVSAIEHLLYEEGQFSSTHSIGLYGNDAMTTGIPSDLYRFYLLYIRPENNSVTSFNWSSFALTVNTELINNIGTFINRTLVFIEDHCSCTVPQYTTLNDRDLTLFVNINNELKKYHNCMERQKLSDGLKCILNISRIASVYVQNEEPRRLVNKDRERTNTLIHISINIVYVLTLLLEPFTPSVSRDILRQLKVPPSDYMYIPVHISQYITSGHRIGEPRPLFMTLDDSRISLLKDKFSGLYT